MLFSNGVSQLIQISVVLLARQPFDKYGVKYLYIQIGHEAFQHFYHSCAP